MLGLVPHVAFMAAVEYYTWDLITDMAEDTPKQPNERSSEALKHYRDVAETFGFAIIILFAEPVALIRKCIHGSGEEFTFSVDEFVPWSWRQMLVSLGVEKGRMIVGSGVSSISLYERPRSYNHHRANAILKHGGRLEVRPPIWDWLVSNADGRGWSTLGGTRRQSARSLNSPMRRLCWARSRRRAWVAPTAPARTDVPRRPTQML